MRMRAAMGDGCGGCSSIEEIEVAQLRTELAGGQGGAAPDFLFATPQLHLRRNGRIDYVFSSGKKISTAENAADTLNLAR